LAERTIGGVAFESIPRNGAATVKAVLPVVGAASAWSCREKKGEVKHGRHVV